MLDARILLVLRLEAKKATKCLDTTLSPKELSLCWDTRFVPCNYERGWKWPLLQKGCQGESVYFYGFFFSFWMFHSLGYEFLGSHWAFFQLDIE